MYSQESSWRSCCSHQEQIAILQEKLMEIHNKLIDQLDICKEQELTIIELNLKLHEKQKHRNIQFDTFKDQSFGQYRYESQKQNSMHNGNFYNHQSRENSKLKNQLLKADLQAMRNKVLMEITQKNTLKEQLKQQKANHRKQIHFQTKKFQGLESILRKLQEQHHSVVEKYDKIGQKLTDIQQKYQKQKDLTKRLQGKSKQLMIQIELMSKQSHQASQKDLKSKDRRYNYQQNTSSQHKKQTQPIKMQRYVINSSEQQPEYREHRQKRHLTQYNDWNDAYIPDKKYSNKFEREDKQNMLEDKRKKKGFEETKQLIKKLQQAELSMRKNRKPIS